VALHPDEERSVTRRCAIMRARTGACGLDVGKPTLDGDLVRDCFGHWTPTSIARADKQDLHAVTHLQSNAGASRAMSPRQSLPGESRAEIDRYNRAPSKATTAATFHRRAREGFRERPHRPIE